MNMLFKILFFWLPSRKVKPTPQKPKAQRTQRTKRTKKK